MDQVSRSGVGTDVTEGTASMGEYRWSSDDHEPVNQRSDPQGQCLAAPQALPAPTYKQRVEEFRKLFRELPESERLIVDYTCALQRDILLQGRLYLSENWLCFYSNVFWGTKIVLTLRDIKAMYREKTARLIPNAIQICTDSEKLFFTSFSSREKSYQGVFRMWQNTLMDKPLTSLELWLVVKQHYGNDLGLSHEEMESLQGSAESTTQTHTSLTMRPGGEDSGRLERPSTLRLQPGDQGSFEPNTTQGEDLPSPLGQSTANSKNADDAHSTSSQCTPDPSLDRSAPERVSKRSELSLDLNTNLDHFSEQSGSESAEEEERVCVSEQQGRLYVNKVFNISAEKMFELLFTDSHFIRRFMNARKITNASFAPWQSEASGAMKRSLNYTIAITNPLVGKFSTATENQILYKESREGQYYLVDAEVYTHDVPYHDYFYTQNLYCIIRHSKHKCRLRVYTDVKYKKQPWGLVKSFITKNSWSGLEDYFRHLESELMEEEAELNQGGGDPGKTIGGLRHRRRRTFSRTLQEHLKPSNQYRPDLDPHREGNTDPMDMKGPQWNVSTIVAGMSIIMLILTVLNLGLFFKLWAMEDVVTRVYLSTKNRLRERTESSFAPDFSPGPAPPHRTREETLLLKAVLQDSINLLEQLRCSLLVLQQNFVTNRTATPQ
ncbi:protein Aster-C isoform X1 [Salmo trutta]|uniref:protein Aster-C isoform X1 n=1 Tax=Salmo trutta TaxID=8032 RepID=UPI0011314403|nr:protein Aster-C-like isoform X1 [Salmo trutta]XP_029611211.1 protein Aster-C-like isoform X1 [Salmo trutta]XP_029611212.1 protein Aster-C-like isoform X1 [Salmo trutta]